MIVCLLYAGMLDSGVGGSKEFKRVMEEVRRQREQLLAFHKRQREEEEELKAELEARKEGSDDEEGSNAEEMQPIEGISWMPGNIIF